MIDCLPGMCKVLGLILFKHHYKKLISFYFLACRDWWVEDIRDKAKIEMEAIAWTRPGRLNANCFAETVSPCTQAPETQLHRHRRSAYPLKKAVGPSLVNMVIAQLGTLGYCPGRELMNLVFTTSAGEARSVVQNPATRADSKWQGTSSERDQGDASAPDGVAWQSPVRHLETC